MWRNNEDCLVVVDFSSSQIFCVSFKLVLLHLAQPRNCDQWREDPFAPIWFSLQQFASCYSIETRLRIVTLDSVPLQYDSDKESNIDGSFNSMTRTTSHGCRKVKRMIVQQIKQLKHKLFINSGLVFTIIDWYSIKSVSKKVRSF